MRQSKHAMPASSNEKFALGFPRKDRIELSDLTGRTRILTRG